jgi:hypothetical protein
MTLETIYKELEKLENDLEYYENRLESLRSLVLPKATQFDKVMVDGGKHVDALLTYVDLENKQQLETTILYIKGKINDLNTLKDKEIDRLAKFGETTKAVVFLRERDFIVDSSGKKRHLYWEEIADKVYCSEKSARNWYKLAVEERKKVLK